MTGLLVAALVVLALMWSILCAIFAQLRDIAGALRAISMWTRQGSVASERLATAEERIAAVVCRPPVLSVVVTPPMGEARH